MSEELVKILEKRLGVTAEQAAGGAGAIFSFAQRRMSANDFRKLADATPAISDLIGKSPRFDPAVGGGLIGWISKYIGGLGALRPLGPVFRQLDLERDSVMRFVDILIQFAEEEGGPQVAAALTKALK